MTPNKQLIFETRKEAFEYFASIYSREEIYGLGGYVTGFAQWLSEENVIIKSEELIMGNLPQTGSIQRLSKLKP
jgi:hypothetical protein